MVCISALLGGEGRIGGGANMLGWWRCGKRLYN